MDDKFFEDLEGDINKVPENIEPVAFYNFEERGLLGTHNKERKFPQCFHKGKTLDADCKMVRCDNCKAYLDPFDVLCRLICEKESKQRHAKRLKDEIENLANQTYELRKELKSLNGKIKRRKKGEK